MSNCQKCGLEVDENMVFCPKCGASLRVASPSVRDWRDDWRAKRREGREQRRELKRQRRQAERKEKQVEWEKSEKHEYMFSGPLIGGLVLIALGALLYMLVVGGFGAQMLIALFFILFGVIIIAAAVYVAILVGRRHPKP